MSTTPDLTVNIRAIMNGNAAGRRVYETQRDIDAFYEAHPEFLAAATVEAQETLPKNLRDELALLYRAAEYAAYGPVRV